MTDTMTTAMTGGTAMTSARPVAGPMTGATLAASPRANSDPWSNGSSASVLDDIKEVYGEAKGNGFDVKVLRKLIGMRKRKDADRQAEDAILDVYLQALGMI
jgi:hypothetical protein